MVIVFVHYRRKKSAKSPVVRLLVLLSAPPSCDCPATCLAWPGPCCLSRLAVAATIHPSTFRSPGEPSIRPPLLPYPVPSHSQHIAATPPQ